MSTKTEQDYFSYVSSRPYSGSDNPMRYIGALNDFCRQALDHKTSLDGVTKSTIDTSIFFNGDKIIQAFCLPVTYQESHNKSPAHHTKFGESYLVETLNNNAISFLDELPENLRESVKYIIDLGRSYQNGDRIEESKVNTTKKHMQNIWDHFDLADPRLQTFEGLYLGVLKNTDEAGAEKSQNDKVDALIETITAPETSPTNLTKAVIALQKEVNALRHKSSKMQEDANKYALMAELGPKAAKTVLYSRVTSSLDADKGTEAFRQDLFNALENVSNEEEKVSVINDMIHDLYGEPKKKKGIMSLTQVLDGVIRETKLTEQAQSVKAVAPLIAAHFSGLYTGEWAREQELNASLEGQKIEEQINAALSLASSYVILNDNGRVVFTTDFAQKRLEEAKALYLQDDLNEDDLSLFESIKPKDLKLKKRTTGSLTDDAYVEADLSILAYTQNTAEKTPDCMLTTALTDKTTQLLADHEFVFSYISSNKSNGNAKYVFDSYVKNVQVKAQPQHSQELNNKV